MAGKKFKGGAKDNKPLFYKTIGYCFYCSFLFIENFSEAKVVLGAPPVAESQNYFRVLLTWR